MHKSLDEFEIRPDQTMATDNVIILKTVLPLFRLFLMGSFSYLQVNLYTSLDEFEIRPGPTTDHRVSCP